ncbi:MAG: malectin domain-containing carbohydrate-binding protein, partial [Terriglobia bacterium]
MPVQHQAEIERAELDTVLTSEIFARSPNLAKILRYIGMKYFEGQEDAIKEYNIGVEALGRPPDFNPKEDSIVRVEAHRLREKLKRYYESEGREHPVVVSLQIGHYVPQFHHQSEAGTPSASRLHSGESPWQEEDGGAQNDAFAAPQVTTPARASPIAIARAAAAGKPPSLASAIRRRLPLVLLAVVIIAGAVAVIVAARARLEHKQAATAPITLSKASAPAVAAVSASAAVGASAGSVVRIIAGSQKNDYVDQSGESWGPDRDYTGGQPIVEPKVFIARAADPALFGTAREGQFSYNIPLKPGSYELRLYFVETEYGPAAPRGGGESSRVFSVDLNGKPLLSGFDIYSDAGGTDIADQRAFKDVSPAADGEIHLSFIAGIDYPILNALQISPSPPGKIQPIRIVTQTHAYTDAAGRVWRPDRYFMGGRLSTSVNQVQNSPDSALYAEERYGNFSYAIPVPEGRYSVSLYFAETYFGPDDLGGDGVGRRVFDVDCNGIALLRDFDIFKEAGGDNRAVVRTFHGLRPNAQGKLLLSF